MNKLKIFKDIFRFCTHVDSNQKLLDLSSIALHEDYCSLIYMVVDLNESQVGLKIVRVTQFFDYLIIDGSVKNFIQVSLLNSFLTQLISDLVPRPNPKHFGHAND